MNNRKRQIEKVRKNGKKRIRRLMKLFTQSILSTKHLLSEESHIPMTCPSIVENCEKLDETAYKILK